MKSYFEERQYLKMIGDELRTSLLVRDATRASSSIENQVELSSKVFVPHFADGKKVMFHLEDRTPGRFLHRPHYFGMEGSVYYRTQETPIVLTLGTTYTKGVIREELRDLENLFTLDCGTYLFFVEKEIDLSLLQEKQRQDTIDHWRLSLLEREAQEDLF